MYGDELFRLEDRKGQSLCLGPTFEEEITDLVASVNHVFPIRQLPLKLYQVSTKYRDEARPRYGLLRGREFIMKDLYSFHGSDVCAKETYDQVVAAYKRIFRALKLDFVQVRADSGAIGGRYTHEFQALADIGEDDIVFCSKGDFSANAETVAGEIFSERDVKENAERSCTVQGCSCGGNGTLRTRHGIEVGQTFLLGKKYSECFDLKTSEHGATPQYVEMGCYGIGVSRLLAAVLESAKASDDDGIIWPRTIAPFDAAILTGSGNAKDQQAMFSAAESFLNDLEANPKIKMECVIDDRLKDSFGKRLAEAKLIGYPLIAIFGKAFLERGEIEVIDRATLRSKMHSKEALLDRFSNL